MTFDFKPFEALPEVIVIKAKANVDERGWFSETYLKSSFALHGIDFDFIQDNQSRSNVRGVLRGLHFQKEPLAQGKLVRCILGEVFDVGVDIRKRSPTYGHWVSTLLSAESRTIIWIPPGFAHGILNTTDVAEVAYKLTSEYNPSYERGIRWNDPALGIPWPVSNPILSVKDSEAPLLKDADNNFEWKKGV